MGRLDKIRQNINKLRSKKTYKVKTVLDIFGEIKEIELKVESTNKSDACLIAQQHIAGQIKMSATAYRMK